MGDNPQAVSAVTAKPRNTPFGRLPLARIPKTGTPSAYREASDNLSHAQGASIPPLRSEWASDMAPVLEQFGKRAGFSPAFPSAREADGFDLQSAVRFQLHSLIVRDGQAPQRLTLQDVLRARNGSQRPVAAFPCFALTLLSHVNTPTCRSGDAPRLRGVQ